jgi:hypothetical protein
VTCNSLKITKSGLSDGRTQFVVNFQEKEINLQFIFETCGAVLQLGDGKLNFTQNGSTKSDGFLSQIFGVRANVVGNLVLNKTQVDLKGLGSLVLQHQVPSQLYV